MKRSAKPSPPTAPAISQEVYVLAKDKVERDYLSLVSDDGTIDPKGFSARISAADDALNHLSLLASHAAPVADEAPLEPTLDQLIEQARLGIAGNKS